MVSKPSYRKSFIKSSMKKARFHGFGGLDLCWLWPNTTSDMENIGVLLDEWREAINFESRNSRMGVNRNHAALFDPLGHISTDSGIKGWLRRGLTSEKLVLGLPYHGYAWKLVNSNDKYSIGALASGPALTMDGSILQVDLNYGYGAISSYNATYVVNYFSIKSIWINFDDVEVIQTKILYAKTKGLLGYNAFQLGNDDDNWELSRAGKLSFGDTAVDEYQYQNAPNLQIFKFSEIKAATGNFSCENRLGEGGYGPVYKGKLAKGGEIAVKRLSKTSHQGFKEFMNEVKLTAKLQHVNLVRLLGFCTDRGEKMLIYEYMPNKSLDFYLFDQKRRLELNLERRVHIIEGIAQGLMYLQEYSNLTIIHRDIKASNILLDDEMKPKISDFGMARILQKESNEAKTGQIVGT
ncbi:LOW QUALITY PROTEIN: cysteine-rich receptor-like protein kinase 25 [Jatropha curcas]|uniref:LOW QUALITY PROTEIN: cysteine-rich receptor-like protein kinase 25 n=1 Tax=Jatropha curcas TaxID=180498 RepID=UPI001893D822|nr:LOW QUALITY PROTEIN: cysteine-rich receptor-like protein kinase 25 [Jatropha curcas]